MSTAAARPAGAVDLCCWSTQVRRWIEALFDPETFLPFDGADLGPDAMVPGAAAGVGKVRGRPVVLIADALTGRAQGSDGLAGAVSARPQTTLIGDANYQVTDASALPAGPVVSGRPESSQPSAIG